MRETDTHVYFWGSFLSNFAWAPFIGKSGNKFHTSEQYFMACKALEFFDVETYKLIMESPDAKSAKALGRKIKGFDAEQWDKVCDDYMFTACWEKFYQNQDFANKLLATGDKILVEASPIDKIWGVGLHEDDDRIFDEKNWTGQNRLGKVLMRVRNGLKMNAQEEAVHL